MTFFTAAVSCVYNVPVRVDEHAEARPDTVSGSPQQVLAGLRGLLELGFTGLNVIPLGPGPQVRRFAEEV